MTWGVVTGVGRQIATADGDLALFMPARNVAAGALSSVWPGLRY